MAKKGYCLECKFWDIDSKRRYKKTNEYHAKCRYNPPTGVQWSVSFEYDWCDKFQPERKEVLPNPRKTELLDKWLQRILSSEEAIELKTILEQEAQESDDARKALILIAIMNLGFYAAFKEES